jgi:cell division protein FtsW (lipid II flippase)
MSAERRLSRLRWLEKWCVCLSVCILVLGVLFVWSTGVHRWENIRTQRLEIGPIHKPALLLTLTNLPYDQASIDATVLLSLLQTSTALCLWVGEVSPKTHPQTLKLKVGKVCSE